MPILIDGYNLLHASGVFPEAGPATFERSREALLDFLSSRLSESDRRRTTIIFDAAEAPPGLPTTLQQAGMKIRFARGYADADTLIEELIAEHHTPRQLTVVSSDHRIQRAARRRRAEAIDSEAWIRHLPTSDDRQSHTGSPPSKPVAPTSEAETNRWMREFGDVSVDAISQEIKEQGAGGSSASSSSEAPADPAPPSEPATSKEEIPPGLENPFPPGYADDLGEEDLFGDGIFPPGYGDDLRE